MGVDLNPSITPGLGGANAAQPVDPAKQAIDAGHGDAAGEPGAQDAVPGVWSQLQQWIATAGLQGTVAVDAPEMAAQQQDAQDGAGRATEAPSALAGQQALGNQGQAALSRDEHAAVVEPGRDPNPANRAQTSAAELTLPTAAAAAQVSTTAHDAVPPQALQQGVLSSLVSGQPQPTWLPAPGSDETRLQRRSSRDGESRSRRDEDDSLFDDDVPEQRLRERDAPGRDTARDHDAARAADDWCVALSRKLARLHRDAGAVRPTTNTKGGSAAPAAAQAIDLALAQWAQGRAVLVVCPQRTPMDDSGWGCLVWGDAASGDGATVGAAAATTGAGRTGATAMAASMSALAQDARARDPPGREPLGRRDPIGRRDPLRDPHAGGAAHPQHMPALRGQRFAARLHWKHDAEDEWVTHARWWAVRAAKQHGVALGRQLRTMSEGEALAGAPASGGLRTHGLAVQLGPVLLPQAREWTLRVRIDAVQRIWASLEGQWSLLVIGCDEPLLPG